MPQGLDLGVLGGQKLERGDLRWGPIDYAFYFKFTIHIVTYTLHSNEVIEQVLSDNTAQSP